jgi:hypothetical protein
MARRAVTGPDGNSGFTLQEYVWRSKPTNSPLTGRPVRCVVGQDEHGQFRAATRIGLAKGGMGGVQTRFAEEPFGTKERAIEAARELTRDFLRVEAECYANTVTNTLPGEQIVRVEMDDGWSMAINAPGAISPEEARVSALFAGFDRHERQAGGLGAREKTRAHLRNRNRGIDR